MESSLKFASLWQMRAHRSTSGAGSLLVGLATTLTPLNGMQLSENPSATSVEDSSQVADATLDAAALEVSQPYVGQWNRLVSQTNWEKGRIIAEWRSALIESGASITAYSDETWARCVGSVTSQHVGRLRRVFERFGDRQSTYEGLYWSHFLAAIDWDDAELWLEGAARSTWSVSEMRRMRSDAMVAAGAEPTKDEELIASEVDDGFVALASEEEADADRGDFDSGPVAEGPDFGDEDEHAEADPDRIQAAESGADGDSVFEDVSPVDAANPFVALSDLPPDVAEAMEQMKLCIIRHRASEWADIHQNKLLQVIDALRSFAART